MSTSLRSLLFSFLVLPVITLAAPAPVTSPPALPATVDVITLAVHAEGENHKLIITSAPELTRIDVPEEDYSLVYNSQTELYTGLERSNYTYWQFSWPEIRAAVENSKRYEARLQELNLVGINSDTTSSPAPATNVTPADAVTAIVPDTSGYVWHQTPEHKKVSGFDCVHWVGETVSGDSVQAWCFAGPLPKLQGAVDRLRMVNEPMALVALRSLVPPFVFPIFDTLVKSGVTPVLIIWGADREKNTFALVDAKTRPVKPDFFTVPKLYMKTTLVSMDGLIDQKK